MFQSNQSVRSMKTTLEIMQRKQPSRDQNLNQSVNIQKANKKPGSGLQINIRDSKKFNTLDQDDSVVIEKQSFVDRTGQSLKKVANRYQMNFAHQYAIPIKNMNNNSTNEQLIQTNQNRRQIKTKSIDNKQIIASSNS